MNTYYAVATLRQLFARQPALLSNVRSTQDPAILAEQLAGIAAKNGIHTDAAEIRRHVRNLRVGEVDAAATGIPHTPHGGSRGVNWLARSECAALLRMCQAAPSAAAHIG